MSNSAVANETKRQIGIWPLAEIGARGFMFDDTALYFDAKPLTRIVRVVVRLENDLYTVTVLHKKTGEELYRIEGVYNDSLPTVIRTLGPALQLKGKR